MVRYECGCEYRLINERAATVENMCDKHMKEEKGE
jgi:hypothetical protein